MPELPVETITTISTKTGAARHQIVYAIRKIGNVRPAGRVGNTDVYSPETAELIRRKLCEIAAVRDGNSRRLRHM